MNQALREAHFGLLSAMHLAHGHAVAWAMEVRSDTACMDDCIAAVDALDEFIRRSQVRGSDGA